MQVTTPKVNEFMNDHQFQPIFAQQSDQRLGDQNRRSPKAANRWTVDVIRRSKINIDATQLQSALRIQKHRLQLVISR